MNLPAQHVVHALWRFVGLRSAWRRSLAMEPREREWASPNPPPDDRDPGRAPFATGELRSPEIAPAEDGSAQDGDQ